MLKKGLKPAIFSTDKAISQRDWTRSLRQEREPINAVQAGFRLVEFLNDNPQATYDVLADYAGITKARVCQMIALCKRLPSEITDFLMNTDESEVLKFFTERRLRPLTLMATDDEKINRFNEMKAELAVNSVTVPTPIQRPSPWSGSLIE
jgi:hypothetical protein